MCYLFLEHAEVVVDNAWAISGDIEGSQSEDEDATDATNTTYENTVLNPQRYLYQT